MSGMQITLFVLIGFFAGIILAVNINSSWWEAQAVGRGAAHYNMKTGKFTWNNDFIKESK